MKKKIIGLLCCCLMAMGSITYASDYTIQLGDCLDITLLENGEISMNKETKGAQYIVRSDGKVSFPMTGEIDVAGMTVSQLTNVLQNRLSRYLVQPQITVNIVKFSTTRVYVFGEVNKPGLYELDKSHNVMDAIGAAGGYTKDAAKKKVFLIRKDHQGEPIKVNLNDLLKKGDVSQNYALAEGDMLYLSGNGRIDFAHDIMPFLSGAYMVSEINKN